MRFSFECFNHSRGDRLISSIKQFIQFDVRRQLHSLCLAFRWQCFCSSLIPSRLCFLRSAVTKQAGNLFQTFPIWRMPMFLHTCQKLIVTRAYWKSFATRPNFDLSSRISLCWEKANYRKTPQKIFWSFFSL